MTKRFMLDTNICIYIANHKPHQVKSRFERMEPGQLIMSAITYGELWYGTYKSSRRAFAVEKLNELIQGVPVQELPSTVSRVYGQIRGSLEKNGRTIGSNDLWIGAHAMALNVTLVTNNEREFRRIAGLNVENWVK